VGPRAGCAWPCGRRPVGPAGQCCRQGRLGARQAIVSGGAGGRLGLRVRRAGPGWAVYGRGILGNDDDSLLLLADNYIQKLRNEPQRHRGTKDAQRFLAEGFGAVSGWPVLVGPRAGRAWARARGRRLWAWLGRAVAWAELSGKRSCPGDRRPVGPEGQESWTGMGSFTGARFWETMTIHYYY
jgi:hypothetical protein